MRVEAVGFPDVVEVAPPFALFASALTALASALARCLSAFVWAPFVFGPFVVGAFVVVDLPVPDGFAASAAATDSAKARTTKNVKRRMMTSKAVQKGNHHARASRM